MITDLQQINTETEEGKMLMAALAKITTESQTDKTPTLSNAKKNGDTIVYLNGFKESINYVMSLSNIVWVDEVKSYDGYSTVQCYEQR
jgi:hypothetical protein